MLNVADIKFTQKTGTELPVQGGKNTGDFSGAANFFSILQNQLGPLEQQNTRPVEKIESSGSVKSASPEKEKPVRDEGAEKRTGEMTSVRTEEQAKQAVAAARREQKPDGEVKAALGDKKTAAEMPAKKMSDKIHGEETARDKKDNKKKDTRDGGNILDGMHRIIDTFHKILNTHDSPPVRQAVKDMKDAADLAKNDMDRGPGRKNLEKALALMEKMSRGALPAETQHHAASAVINIKDLLAKLKPGQEKHQQARHQEPAEGASPARTEISARIDLPVDGMKGNGTGTRSGNDGGDQLGFNLSRGGETARRMDTAQASSMKNSQFRESLENIIQNAKVVVKDSRNGSFSVRLFPKELGSVNVNIGLRDGVIHGRFLVESQAAKELLMANIDSIRERLTEAGIQVGEFQVNVQDQRGRFLRDTGDQPHHFFTPAAGAETVEVEYSPNSRPLHDGLINLMI